MAEGIESYDHVPQQSRRDKLREHPDHHHRSNFLPFYDPSSSDSSNRFQFHHHPFFDPQIQSPLFPEIHSFPTEPLSLSLSSHPNLLASPITPPLPLGPFTGYASILKGSRFLKPAHHLLQDLCDSVHFSSSSSFIHDPSSDSFPHSPILDHHYPLPSSSDSSTPPHKSTLLSMLDEVLFLYLSHLLL